MMTIGAAYIRVSTNDQTEFSPEAQKKAIIEYANKNNISIPDQNIFLDDGYSGKIAEKRPAFMYMIKVAKSKPKPFDVIIVHRYDRFARNREDSVLYKSLLKKEYDIKVVSVTEQLEDDKFSIILESMLEAMAEYYSLNLADEVKKGMKEKARRGGFQTRPPFGYEVKEKGNLEIVKPEADAIRYIYNKFINVYWEPIKIAREINNLGYKTKNKGKFDTRAIERILSNPIYIGYIRWNRTSKSKGKLIKNDEENWIIEKGEHESIITVDEWDKAQLILLNRKKKTSTKQWSDSKECKHWLRGVLKCAYCGGAMVYGQNSKDNYRYFRCNNRTKGKCDKSNYVSILKIEVAILKQIGHDFNDLKFNITNRSASYPRSEVIILRRQLRKIDSKLDRVKEAFLSNIDTIEEYEENKVKLINERNRILNTLNYLLNEEVNINEGMSKISSIYEYLNDPSNSMEDKNRALKSIISKILVDGSNKTIKIIYYLD